MRRRRPLLWVVGWLALWSPPGQTQDSTASERQRIFRERQAVDARYRDAQADCAQRFVVTPCMEEASKRRREALAPLRQQELILSDRERKQRAAERSRDIERNRLESDARTLVPPPIASAVRGRPADLPASSPAPASQVKPAPAPGRSGAHPGGHSEDVSKAASRASEAARRRVEAQADRERIRARIDKRAAEGKKTVPLPLPDAKP